MVTGDKWRRIGVDGGQQLGRCLSFLVTGATEEEEEKEEEEEEEEEEKLICIKGLQRAVIPQPFMSQY